MTTQPKPNRELFRRLAAASSFLGVPTMPTPAIVTGEPSQAATAYGREAARRLLANRKGHGGGRVVYRQFDEAHLAALTTIAFQAGVDAARRGQR